MNLITKDVVYDKNFPGNHVSWWTTEKIELLCSALLAQVIVITSKYQGSTSTAMRGSSFGNTVPFLSLYVEIIKLP